MRFMIRGYRIIIFEISSAKYFQEIKSELLKNLHKLDAEMRKAK